MDTDIRERTLNYLNARHRHPRSRKRASCESMYALIISGVSRGICEGRIESESQDTFRHLFFSPE